MQTTLPGALLAGSSDPPDVSGTSGEWRHSTGAGGARLEVEQLTRAQNGDRTAFRALVLAHQAAVYSLAWRLLGVREDAQELAQDVFMLMHRYLADITSAAHLRFWLRRTVCHRAIDRLRRRPSQPLVSLETVAELEAPATDSDPLWHRHLCQFTAQLPMMPRAVLLLRYQEDLDPAEIARTLELPVNTVKSHLKRSLALLRSRCAELRNAGNGERSP